MRPNDPPRRPQLHRLVWFVWLWMASVAVLATVALFFRMLMNWAGMTV